MRKESRQSSGKQEWVTATLIRFGEPNEFGETFTADTQITLPDGTLMEEGQIYSSEAFGDVRLLHYDDNGLHVQMPMPPDFENGYQTMMHSFSLADVDLDWLMENGRFEMGDSEISLIPKGIDKDDKLHGG